jgi:hypothetical protein
VHFSLRKRRNRVAVEISFLTISQGSRSGNPGLKARWGINENPHCQITAF